MLKKTIITLSIAAISTLSANDFNKDGIADLVFQNSNGYVKTWELDSTGAKVTERWLTNLGSTDWEICKDIIDLDNDGDVDILLQNKTNGYLKTLQMNGFALDSTKWTGNPDGEEWKVVGLSDIDNDNYPDIILQHSTSGYIKAFKMDVNSKGTSQWIGNPGSADWEVVKVTDVDNDGIVDIIMQSKSLGYVKAFKLASDFTATAKWVGNPGLDWKIEKIDDIDGDDIPDIIFQNETSGYIKAFKLASDFSNAAKWIGNPGSTDWDISEVSDVDGDGVEDIILRSNSLGYVKAFKLASDFSSTAKWVGNPGSSDWEIVSANDSTILFQSQSLSYLKAFDLSTTFASTVRWVGNPGDWNFIESEAVTTQNTPSKSQDLSGNITSDLTLTADTLWKLDGLVVVTNGATLTIEAGTTIAGYEGTGANTSYMIIDKSAKIMAEGTASSPITFTSTKVAVDGEDAAVGQWGGLTIIGHAGNSQVNPYEVNADYEADATDLTDNSGTLKHVKILNSGITLEQDKEINGLSLIGVGSGTTISDITVDLSDDDGVEIWGGTVNLSNVTITRCTDDYFDVDDGYAGTVTNLNITTTTGNAGIEMSGTTAATFDTFTITQNGSAKEGGIYFKKDSIGGHFLNGTVTDNVDDADNAYGAIYSKSADKASDTVDQANISFENVTLNGSATGSRFTGTSATTLEGIFDAGTNNTATTVTSTPSKSQDLSGNITSDLTLTADTLWKLDGLVVVTNGATLTIEAGTTIAGYEGTGANTSYMIIDKSAKIMAEGTASSPITFTSTKVAVDGEDAAVGQWGGLTIIGHAGNSQVNPYEVNADYEADATDLTDNSGTLKHVKILNSGITLEQDKEINGLSLIGVGSGTTISDITVDLSDDDGVEIWGGTVNLSNVTITRCTDDYFDVDDGYAGTVTNLNITTTTGNAGIEMSGTTAATFDTFTITQNGSAKEGGIYFKKDSIGGHFLNGTVTDNVDDADNAYGAIYSKSADKASDTVDQANISFENVTLNGSATGSRFTGTSATTLEGIFDADSTNTKN